MVAHIMNFLHTDEMVVTLLKGSCFKKPLYLIPFFGNKTSKNSFLTQDKDLNCASQAVRWIF